MLLLMYQIFSSLQGHLPFLVHFLLHFYGVTFFGTPNNDAVDATAAADDVDDHDDDHDHDTLEVEWKGTGKSGRRRKKGGRGGRRRLVVSKWFQTRFVNEVDNPFFRVPQETF